MNFLFGSDRSSIKANLCSSIRSVQVCLEQSIFIILAQIFKQSVRNKSTVNEHSKSIQRALREHSESTQRELREHSERTQKANRQQSVSTQSIKIKGNTVGAFKYCILFSIMSALLSLEKL